jgi:predicted O-methyltransferase YrrM
MKDITWMPSWASYNREDQVHPHQEEEKSHLFHALDSGSTEYEVLNWIHSTIRVLKPKLVLETGAYEGIGTLALAHACKLNGFGKVISIENDSKQCVKVEEILEENNLKKYAEVICSDSIEFLNITNYKFEIGFFDSETTIRAKECEICLDRDILNNVAIFHDTSPYRLDVITPQHIQQKYRSDVFELARHPNCTGYYDSCLSRGFMALWLKNYS